MLLLAACAPAPPAIPPASRPPHAIGGQRDAHGCLPAAGDQWCTRTRQCERPWELARAQGFDNSPAGFDHWCAASAPAQR